MNFGKFVPFCLIALCGSTFTAYAYESSSEIDVRTGAKKALIQQLNYRIHQHDLMSLDEIRTDLLKGIEENREFFRSKGALSIRVKERLDQAQAEVLSLNDKQALLKLERAALTRMVSAKNYVFYLMRFISDEMETGRHDPDLILTITFLALDLVLLPFQIVATIVTGC